MSEPEVIAPRPLRVNLQTKIVVIALACVAIPVLLMAGYLLQQNQEILGEKVRETLSNHLQRTDSDLRDGSSSPREAIGVARGLRGVGRRD